MSADRLPTVAIYIRGFAQNAWSAGVIAGAANYFQEHRNCHLDVSPIRIGHLTPELAVTCDGIIAMVTRIDVQEDLRRFGKPVVNVSNRLTDSFYPKVVSDDYGVGALAARHFIERHFRNLAYKYTLSIGGTAFQQLRQKGFVDTLRSAGLSCTVLSDPDAESMDHRLAITAADLLRLPKPVGILACDDYAAATLLQAAEQAGLHIPDEVAILGVNNSLMDDFLTVPLSSVQPAFPQIGYEATALMIRILNGEPPPTEPVLFPPTGIVARESTDIVADADPVVLRIRRLIRTTPPAQLHLRDMVSASGLSRRNLERLYAVLGGTLENEILQSRLRHARALLVDTERTIPDIAADCGFHTGKELTAAFFSQYGTDPVRYREQNHRIGMAKVP